MTRDEASTWITTVFGILGAVVLVVAILLSAHGPGIPSSGDGLLSGPPEPSPAAQALDRGDTVLFGAWLGTWPSADNQALAGFEETTATELEIVDIYLDWSTPPENLTHSIRHVTEKGAVPQLTWEAHGLTTPEILEGTKTLHLRGGETMDVDAYLEAFAERTCQTSQETGDPILVRPFHEMNGRWFHWSIGYEAEDGSHPNTNETYKEAWRKVHRAFQEACAPGGEVRLVWAVNHVNLGPNTSYLGTYPGDAYVDYVGIDGYNWGGAADWGWGTFPDLFDRAYCAVTQGTDRPVFISEWGSVEQGGDKAAWIGEGLDRVAAGKYPEVRAMIWLNDLKKEREIGDNVDWRINSSPEALQAYSQGVGNVKATWNATQAEAGTQSVCR